MNRFILFISFLPNIYGFLPPLLREKLIVSNLEAILSNKAMTSSIITTIQKEMDIEHVMLQIFPLHSSSTTFYIYMSVIITVIYGQWQYYNGSQYDKLRKIDKFSSMENMIKKILLIFIIVFMKDVEHAT